MGIRNSEIWLFDDVSKIFKLQSLLQNHLFFFISTKQIVGISRRELKLFETADLHVV